MTGVQTCALPIFELFRETNASVRHVLECLFDDVHGLRLLRDETGSLTLSPNIIKFRRGNLDVVCDVRYPATLSLNEVLAEINKFGVKYETLHHQEPLYHEKSDLLIATLLSVFRECTGQTYEPEQTDKPAAEPDTPISTEETGPDEVQPIAIGGGTYARALKHGAAFGPEMEGDEAVVHQPNEYITLDRVKLLLKIYKTAIERLTV